jgi:CRP-like cAMP-binding protein
MKQHASGLTVDSFGSAAVANRPGFRASSPFRTAPSMVPDAIRRWFRERATLLRATATAAVQRFRVVHHTTGTPGSSAYNDVLAAAEREGELGRSYQKGEIIFRQGDPGDAMFVIQSGSVELLREDHGQQLCVGELGEGDLFGEMALFEQNMHTTTVRALTNLRLITVERRVLLRNIHQDASLAFRIMSCMALRISLLSGACTYLSRARLEAAMVGLEQDRTS